MPKRLPVHNIGLKGLNTDIHPVDLPNEFISYGFNFKVYMNSLISTGGYADLTEAEDQFFGGLIFPVSTPDAYYWVVAGRTAVQIWDGANWSDITSAEGYTTLNIGDEYLWTHCYLGQIPIINNPQAYPEYWSPATSSQVLQALPWDSGNTWADRGITAQVIRSHKNFLFALNITDGATAQPDTYRWSTAADINGLPFTWDEADTSAIAGVASLGGDNGAIVDGLSLRDSFCIYSEFGIDILDYTGGEFIWTRRELSNSVGLLNRNCIVEVQGSHYFMSNGDILQNDGTNIKSIIRGRIQNMFNAHFNSDSYNRAFVVKNQNSKEIWFCVPQGSGTSPTVAYVYNWVDDSWSIRDLPDDLAFASYGIIPNPAITWATTAGNWDSQTKPWVSNNNSPLSSAIIGVTNNPTSIKLLEPINVRDSGDLSSIIERTDFPLVDVVDAVTITRVYPHIKGTSPVSIQLGSQLVPSGPTIWKPAVTFNPGVDRKVDIRTTGILHSWRVASLGSGHWEFSGMDIEYEEMGVR